MLTINAGSSTIKFSVFAFDTFQQLYHGIINKSTDTSRLEINSNENVKQEIIINTIDHDKLIEHLITVLLNTLTVKVQAIGHRVVHGGSTFCKSVIIDDLVISELKKLIPLAPLHQSHNLQAIEIFNKHFPKIKQIACFDTAFHSTQSKLNKAFALPKQFMDEGIIRYGFHGISYEYIASRLHQYIPKKNCDNVIVAHLGSGCSMCAIANKKSIATSMGFTTLDGLIMGTRCGSIDPGLILFLQQEKNMTPKQIEHMLYHDSGLKGVSQISDNMEILLESKDENAKFAIELFCYHAACEFAKLTIALKRVDALIFTAGIGENSPIIRGKICEYLKIFNIKLNHCHNEQNRGIISLDESSVMVAVIPTNEELMIAKHIHQIV